jgi:hypothetical protein
MLKPIIHYTFFEKQEEFINYDRYSFFYSYDKNTYTKDSYGNLAFYGKPSAGINYREFREKNISTQKGEQIIRISFAADSRIYYFHPKEIKTVSFKKHLKAMFIDKNWVFFISFGSLLLLVVLMNDKIKAR